MKTLFTIIAFVLLGVAHAQDKRVYYDTCRQDEYHLYKVINTEDTMVVITIYKYQYIFKQNKRSHYHKRINILGDDVEFLADNHNIAVSIGTDKTLSYQFIVWIKPAVYVVTVENGKILKVTRNEELRT